MSGLTANYNNYSAIELEKALQSWVEPYPKPIILNHDLNSEPIGRVIAAKMDKEVDGAPYVRLQVAITDPLAAQKISDKRYLTGSVGGRAGKAVCSISGEDLAAESTDGRPKPVKYKRGQVYKGKLAFVDMQDISFKEYSFVNQPADQRSSVRASKSIDGAAPITDSDNWTAKSTAFILHMDKEDIVSVEENESILKNMKKKESRPLYLHLKGAFLTALAFQESETANADNSPLLSEKTIDNEENLKMDQTTNNDDILAAVENLSQDLSAINAAPVAEETQVEESVVVEESAPAEESVVVEEAVNTEVASALQNVLDHTVVFYYSAHRAHWNVEGEDFAQYHELFSNIYEDASGAIDPIAENIRKVQGTPTSLTSSIMNASFKDDATSKDAMVLAADLLSKNDVLNQAILSAFTTANASNEQGIANFLAERDDMHKKWAWQLRASLNMENDMEAKESWNITTNGSEAIAEATEEPTEEVVDSVNPEVAPEAGEQEEPKAELTEEPKAAEQDVNDDKLQVLQEENAKLREALHRTLVERVVDTKISLGVEAVEEREQLINDHVTRSAGSLADSLRDLAKMPVAKKSAQKLNETAIVENDIVFEKEDNVVVEDEEVTTAPKAKVNTVEELFVDAFMGRRKL
jgi:starvation-inducible DNA-binding protein